MKKIIGLVVIIAAIVLGSYYGMGFITERTIKKNLTVINQSNGIQIKIVSYDRGWFTSKAVFDWNLHLPERQSKDQNGDVVTIDAQDYHVNMPIIIYHGPIIYSDQGVKFGFGYAHSEVKLPSTYVKKFESTFTSDSIKPILDLSLYVNYLNKSQLHIGIPTFKLISKEGGDQFEWNGLKSDMSLSFNLDNIDGHLALEGGSFTKNNTKATLSEFISDYNLYQNDMGLYLGQASLSMSSFKLSDNNQSLFDVEQINIQSNSDVKDGLFNSHLKTSLTKLSSQDKNYGPATIEMSLDNLDAQVLADINAQANKMQQGTDAQKQQALLALIPQLPKLLNKGAKFEISKLNIVVPEGDIAGDLSLSFPAGGTGNPFQMLQQLDGQAKLKVPATVLRALMVTSAKQKLLSEPSLQQAMVQQMKENDSQAQPIAAPASQDEKAKNVKIKSANGATQQSTSEDPKATPSAADIDQQANEQADQRLAKMQELGLLILQGNEYVVELSLAAGQLTVNGKAFTPDMMQF